MTVELKLGGFEDAVAVGWGGFAVVYRARQSNVDREVALKVLNVRPGVDVAEAFRRECAAIGSLSGHPNIVTVHGIGETPDGRPFIVMEYLHRGSLGDVVRAQGPLPWTEVAVMGVQLAGALETAHLAGLVHRDVKPENVLVSRFGQPKLGDFGIALLHGSWVGSSGGVIGSLRHAAPEVLEGRPPTVASDVYSLGSTMFTAITGGPPFGSGGDGDGSSLRTRILDDPVPDLRPSGVPDPVCRVIEQALAKDPDDRQASAQALGQQLRAALGASGASVPRLPIGPGPTTHTRAHRAPRAVAAAVAVAGLVVMTVVLASRSSRSGRGEEAARPTTSSSLAASTSSSATTTATTTPPPEPGSFTDDFSGNRPFWGDLRDSTGTCVGETSDGRFRLVLSPPPTAQSMTIPPLYAPIKEAPSHMVRIEVDVTKTSTGRADFGVACGGASSQFPYSALVDVDGWWRLVRTAERGAPVDVRSGRERAAMVGPGPHRIALECTGEGNRVSMTLWVDGLELATATGPRGTDFRPGPGLYALAFTSPLDVLFDNLDLRYS